MKAIICGAGIAGLAAARFLGVKGWDVLVLEIAPKRRSAGYMIDFAGSGYDAMERAGLLDALRQRQQPVDQMKYVREDGSVRSRISFDLFAASMNGRIFSVLRGDIEAMLFEALPDSVDMRFGVSVSEVVDLDGRVDVILSDGVRETGDLLIGADGIHSDLRGMVFGAEADYLRYLNFHTAAFLFEDADIAKTVSDEFQMLSVAKRQAAIYNLGDGKLATFFAHTATNRERPVNPAVELRRVYGELGWHVPAMLDAADRADDIYYDLLAQIEMPTWSKGRAIMLGDAGYAVSLLAGQGASLAIAGAWMLAEQIGAGDIDAGMARFEAEMKPEVLKKQAAGRRTANWMVPPTGFHNVTRDVFLNATRLPGLSWMLAKFFAPSLKSIMK
jgi:2-polyprenyl-6-methoxyphenol hydroxylase-like FAD-dependent oxidoreductase